MIDMIRLATMGLLPLALAATPAMASETTAEQVIVPAPPPGKAEMVFFRAGGFAGSAISCAVAENGVKISSLPGAHFFILVADPGHHAYTVSAETKDQILYELKPGQINYVKCHVEMGIMAGRPKLTAVMEQEFTTKPWKSVEKSRMSANVLTDEQIKAAIAMQSAAAPDATATTTAATTPVATTSLPVNTTAASVSATETSAVPAPPSH